MGARWTQEEKEKLKQVYSIWTKDELETYFGRKYPTVQKQANTLGIQRRNNNWREEDINFLLSNFSNMTLKEIATLMDKSITQTRQKVKELKLRKGKERVWTEEKLKGFVESRNYVYIKSYRDNGLKIEVICDQGHQYITTFQSFQNGCECGFCKGGIRFDFDFVRTQIEKEGYKLHSETYENAQGKLKIECPNGHVYKQSWNSFQQDKRCHTCSMKKVADMHRLSYEIVEERFSQRGYFLTTKEYVNSQQKLEYICPFHPNEIQTITMGNLIDGHGCKSCQNEKLRNDRKTDFEIVKQDFHEKGLELLSNEDDYQNCFQKLKFICSNHREHGIQEDSYTHLKIYKTSICVKCRNELLSGENSPFWKGGLTEINLWLRDKIVDWKKESMKDSDYKCVLTGDKFDDIHHLYSFNLILQEIFENTDLPIRQYIKDYTLEELQMLTDYCIKLHNKYPKGVCLRKDIHQLFHSIYGYGDNTPEQFNEFRNRYFNKEIINI